MQLCRTAEIPQLALTIRLRDISELLASNPETVFLNVEKVSNYPSVGARNQVGIGLSYRPASLSSLATQFQTRFLETIPRPIAGLKFSAQESIYRNPFRQPV
jgi:hypothetical protein